jgi:hypothetical protein
MTRCEFERVCSCVHNFNIFFHSLWVRYPGACSGLDVAGLDEAGPGSATPATRVPTPMLRGCLLFVELRLDDSSGTSGSCSPFAGIDLRYNVRCEGASRFLFDAGPSLATCRVERRRRHAASGGPTRKKQAMTKKRDAPRCDSLRFAIWASGILRFDACLAPARGWAPAHQRAAAVSG